MFGWYPALGAFDEFYAFEAVAGFYKLPPPQELNQILGRYMSPERAATFARRHFFFQVGARGPHEPALRPPRQETSPLRGCPVHRPLPKFRRGPRTRGPRVRNRTRVFTKTVEKCGGQRFWKGSIGAAEGSSCLEEVGIRAFDPYPKNNKPAPGEKKTQFPRSTGVRGSRARCNCN
jgi:hypothetical protein